MLDLVVEFRLQYILVLMCTLVSKAEGCSSMLELVDACCMEHMLRCHAGNAEQGW